MPRKPQLFNREWIAIRRTLPLGPRVLCDLATVGPAGYCPVGPGTAGSLCAFLVWPALRLLPSWGQWTGLLLLTLLAVWTAEVARRAMGLADPGRVVIDEVVGCLLACLFVPDRWPWLLAAFAGFRLFDIAKPFPVSWFDRKVKGGLGIVLDDVAAGLIAGALLWLAHAYQVPALIRGWFA